MPEQRGEHTYAEIMSQPEVWKQAIETFLAGSQALQNVWRSGSFDQVIFTGCGSTYYLSQVGASLFQTQTGIPARAYPASEIALFPDLVFRAEARPLLVTVSRSGETTETVAAVRAFRQRTQNPVIAVTCASQSTLAQIADASLNIDAAQETSLAQTRSFASMLIVVQGLCALLGGQQEIGDRLAGLPAVAGRLLQEYHDLARMLGENGSIERFFFLGSGFLYGIAAEAMLKMKEMSLSYSEAYHMLEFRHGPMSMVNDRSLVVGLVSEAARQQEASVLRDMRARGAHILALAETQRGLDLPAESHLVRLDSDVPEWARPVVYLPVLQLMAYYRAMSNGQNPDKPENLSFVISLDESMT